jgi:hypothetical protein
MTNTSSLRSKGAELASRTDQVLAQSAKVREQAVQLMDAAADIEDELAAVLDKVAASRPDAAGRLGELAREARKQAERTRRWVKEHAVQTPHDCPEGGAVPSADALRARGADVARAVASTHDEIAAVMQTVAGWRPRHAPRLRSLSEEAGRRAVECRDWAQHLSA